MKLRNIAVGAVLLAMLAAPLVYASGGEGPSPWDDPMKHVGRVLNFIILMAVLIHFLKKPMMSFFSERSTQIQKDLDEATEQRDKAQAALEEYKTKLAGMEQELVKMRVELQKAGELESQKITVNADRMANAMVEAAKLAAEQEVRKARELLKTEAVELAVEMAESLIRDRIDEGDRKRIVEDYLVKVGGMK
jgi:F-type H+-transporting ATPase subunit b